MNERWKPGDVAMVTFASGHEGLAVYGTSDNGRRFDNCWRFGAGAFEWHDSDNITTARRLAVIDPSDREQVERLAKDYHESEHLTRWPELHNVTRVAITDALTFALHKFANPTPPKPEEPTGLGAVVEDADGYQWVYSSGPQPSEGRVWYSPNLNGTALYSEITAVRVLAEGVTP